jgi:hypothetical protein
MLLHIFNFYAIISLMTETNKNPQAEQQYEYNQMSHVLRATEYLNGANNPEELATRREELFRYYNELHQSGLADVQDRRNDWLEADSGSSHTQAETEGEINFSRGRVGRVTDVTRDLVGTILNTTSQKAQEFMAGGDADIWREVQRRASTGVSGVDSRYVQEPLKGASSDSARSAMRMALDADIWREVQRRASTGVSGVDSRYVQEPLKGASSQMMKNVFMRILSDARERYPGYDGMFGSSQFRYGFRQGAYGGARTGERSNGQPYAGSRGYHSQNEQRQTPPPSRPNYNTSPRPAYETDIDVQVMQLRGQGMKDTSIARKLARQYHPDMDGGSEDAMKYINNLFAKKS